MLYMKSDAVVVHISHQICCFEHADESYQHRFTSSAEASGYNLGMCKAYAWIIDFQDLDPSIRKRALELVYLLVNETNAKSLTKELIGYLRVSDQEFKGDLTAKIFSIVEKFATEKIWYIDQMLMVLSEAGNFVKDDVWHSLIVVISNASDLHGYTVRSLYRAIQTSAEQESLVQVAVWCIGEYGEMLVDNVGMLDIEEPRTVSLLCKIFMI
ncbi:unnamed protein product [Thlaspi arvense]|uniref:Clathrin/coatomer adaptor adaptin-like N-terminal domain-containing protein n=1 Tax=Thlaspi arvense TaxID=13288 RepID=A0AAU9RFN7_THLAR|nr:unnamed protein product [Thlaspi arvense]